MVERPPKTAERAHLLPLDGLRGLAILSVVWHHALCEPHPVVAFHGSLSSLVHNVLYAGWTGVDLFFVLSGFLITGILLDAKGSARLAHPFRSFYGRRTLRIFPLYYASIAWLGILIHLRYPTLVAPFRERLPWLAVYASNVAMAVHRTYWFTFGGFSLDHFWSLAVEEQFYLLWPAVVLFCSVPTLKRVCFAAIALALAARWFSYIQARNFWLTAYALPCRADALALGALTALRFRERTRFGATAFRELLASGALVLLTFFDEGSTYLFGLTAMAWFYASVLTLSLTTPLGTALSLAPLRSIGKYSYGIYVLHALVFPYLWVAFGGEAWFAGFLWYRRLAFAAALMAGSYAVALVSWNVLEKHFLALKRYFPA